MSYNYDIEYWKTLKSFDWILLKKEDIIIRGDQFYAFEGKWQYISINVGRTVSGFCSIIPYSTMVRRRVPIDESEISNLIDELLNKHSRSNRS